MASFGGRATSESSPRSLGHKITPGTSLLLLGFFSTLLYFPGLGELNIPTNFDEYLYASISHAMRAAGQWLTPIGQDGNPLFFKPPATYWQAIGGLAWVENSLRGVHSSLVPVQVLSVLGVYGCLRLMSVSRWTPFLGSWAFAVSNASFKLTRNLIMENLLTLWMVATVGLFLLWQRSGKIKWLWINAGLAGVACLIKGIIALPMFGLFLVAFLSVYGQNIRKWISASGLHLIGALVTATVIGFVWPLIMVYLHGWPFVEFHFLQEHFGKFHEQPNSWGRIFSGYVLYTLPFTPWVLGAAAHAMSQAWSRIWRSPRPVLFLWIGLILNTLMYLMFFRRAMNYVLPFIPVVFLITAVCWEEVWATKKFSRTLAVGGLLACVFINLGFMLVSVGFWGDSSLKVWALLIATLVLAGVGSSLLYLKTSPALVYLTLFTLEMPTLWSLALPLVVKPNIQWNTRLLNPEVPVCMIDRQGSYERLLLTSRFLPHPLHVGEDIPFLKGCLDRGWAVLGQGDLQNQALQSLLPPTYEVAQKWLTLPKDPHWEFKELFRFAELKRSSMECRVYAPSAAIRRE
jgi:4-amino-4-deoxy-L-arabinose transferase-like glycosyltransferase